MAIQDTNTQASTSNQEYVNASMKDAFERAHQNAREEQIHDMTKEIFGSAEFKRAQKASMDEVIGAAKELIAPVLKLNEDLLQTQKELETSMALLKEATEVMVARNAKNAEVDAKIEDMQKTIDALAGKKDKAPSKLQSAGSFFLKGATIANAAFITGVGVIAGKKKYDEYMTNKNEPSVVGDPSQA